MEREIETVREKPHWSCSAFNTFLACPMRYYFRYIEHAEVERTPISIPFGRAIHLVLSERAMKGTNYTIEQLKARFNVSSLEDLSRTQCSRAIDLLNGKAA